MVMKYVIAGTSPLSDWPDDLHILLKNAIEAKWATDVTDPPIANVTFNDSWWDGASDVQFTFKFLREDYNPHRRDNAWIRRNTISYLNVHMWIRKTTVYGGTETNYRYKAKKAFWDIVELNNTTLLPPAIVTVEDITEIIDDEDHLADTLHFRIDVNVWYDKVKVNLP